MKKIVIVLAVMVLAALGACSVLGDGAAVVGDWYMSSYINGLGGTPTTNNLTNGQSGGINLTIDASTVTATGSVSGSTNFTLDSTLGTWVGEPIHDDAYTMTYTVDETTLTWNYEVTATTYEKYIFTKI